MDVDITKPTVTLTSITSDNTDTKRAKVHDAVTLLFESSEDLRSIGGDRKSPALSGVKLVDRPVLSRHVSQQSGDGTGTKWQATYTLAAGDTEGDLAILVNAGYTDLAGNPLGWQKTRALIKSLKKLAVFCLFDKNQVLFVLFRVTLKNLK